MPTTQNTHIFNRIRVIFYLLECNMPYLRHIHHFLPPSKSRIIDADEIYHWCSENCPKSIIVLNVRLWGGVRWIRIIFTETQHNFRKIKQNKYLVWCYMKNSRSIRRILNPQVTVYTSSFYLVNGTTGL